MIPFDKRTYDITSSSRGHTAGIQLSLDLEKGTPRPIEQVIEDTDKLKQELLHFLNFGELTPEILHRLINRIDVKEDGTPVIHYQFAAPTYE